ncbi:DUF423 domain-containing protein [Methylomarinum vadi]|uniref:DUF423 domain-containing protein n=1 Tax=Methylomarinum vadi TaxID=438855 RepID=UPI0004DF508E|nr:DUF423 domain-containing protein [Methylomarinum vadi]
MRSVFLFLAALSAMLAVMLGAFGAHGLKHVLSADMLAVYKTAVTYQMWHALGLAVIAVCRQQIDEAKLLVWAGWLMFVGILLFSGSLYLLTLLNLKWLGMVTPIGGVAFIAAWLLLLLYAAGVGNAKTKT